MLMFVLMLLAAICFLITAANIPVPPRVNLLALGLFFMALAFAVGSGVVLH